MSVIKEPEPTLDGSAFFLVVLCVLLLLGGALALNGLLPAEAPPAADNTPAGVGTQHDGGATAGLKVEIGAGVGWPLALCVTAYAAARLVVKRRADP